MKVGAVPPLDLYPARRNEAYRLDVPLTKAEDAANYNNFYEFGMSKDIVDASQRLATRPWSIQVDGMVEVLSGLQIGERVVTEGASQMQNGDKVVTGQAAG